MRNANGDAARFSSQSSASTQRRGAEISYRKAEVTRSRRGSVGVPVSFVPPLINCDVLANGTSIRKPKGQRAFRHPPSIRN